MGSEKNGDFQKALKELQGLDSQWDWKAGNEFSQNFCNSQTNVLNDFFFLVWVTALITKNPWT